MARGKNFEACTFEGCTKPHQAKGYCSGHYRQYANGEPLRKLKEKAVNYSTNKMCDEKDCIELCYAKDKCKSHYETERMKKNGKTSNSKSNS
jgi:hypothetical protein